MMSFSGLRCRFGPSSRRDDIMRRAAAIATMPEYCVCGWQCRCTLTDLRSASGRDQLPSFQHAPIKGWIRAECWAKPRGKRLAVLGDKGLHGSICGLHVFCGILQLDEGLPADLGARRCSSADLTLCRGLCDQQQGQCEEAQRLGHRVGVFARQTMEMEGGAQRASQQKRAIIVGGVESANQNEQMRVRPCYFSVWASR